jgi:hypothetical protein
MKPIEKIIAEYLIANGYDGLAGDGCGCLLDDLIPGGIDCDILNCVPGHRVSCKGCKKEKELDEDFVCPYYGGEDGDYCVIEGKRDENV